MVKVLHATSIQEPLEGLFSRKRRCLRRASIDVTYARYYNEAQTHHSLNKDAPLRRHCLSCARRRAAPPMRPNLSSWYTQARSMRSMARLLGHAPSTVSREIKRNGGYNRYRAAVADENAWRRRPKGCKLATNPWLRRTVARKLESNWSPEPIAGWLKRA
jgi:hypothetical protein